jgi:hypothetical protein
VYNSPEVPSEVQLPRVSPVDQRDRFRHTLPGPLPQPTARGEGKEAVGTSTQLPLPATLLFSGTMFVRVFNLSFVHNHWR